MLRSKCCDSTIDTLGDVKVCRCCGKPTEKVLIKCGECGHENEPDMMNNCPDCGANMDEDIEEYVRMASK